MNWNYQPNTIFPQPVFGIECLDFCNIQDFPPKLDPKIPNNTQKVNNENSSLAPKTTKSKLIQTSCPNGHAHSNSKSIQSSCSNTNAHVKKNSSTQLSPKLSNCNSNETQGAPPLLDIKLSRYNLSHLRYSYLILRYTLS